MLVKICGITSLVDAEAAVECGADAIGFVFWPESPRYVDPDHVRAIVESLPASVMKVGVFVNQTVAHVNQVARAAGLTHVQLHGDETPDMAASIRLPVIKAASLTAGQSIFGEWPADTTWLVDAHDPVRRGGTGMKGDWAAAAMLARTRRVWLAGGLTAGNVAEAVEQVGPFGIDVSSGVERTPGVKDHEKMRALFDAVGAKK